MSTTVSQENCPLVESLALSQPDQNTDIPESLLQAHALSSMDWRKAQRQDPTLKVIIDNLEVGSRVSAQQTQIDRRYLKKWEKYYISQDVLYRRGELNGQPFQQLVLPWNSEIACLKRYMMTLGIKEGIGLYPLLSSDFTGQGLIHT